MNIQLECDRGVTCGISPEDCPHSHIRERSAKDVLSLLCVLDISLVFCEVFLVPGFDHGAAVRTLGSYIRFCVTRLS